jgi:hypothetical protein
MGKLFSSHSFRVLAARDGCGFNSGFALSQISVKGSLRYAISAELATYATFS